MVALPSVRRPTVVYPYSGATNVPALVRLEGDSYKNKFGIERHTRRFQVDVEDGDFF